VSWRYLVGVLEIFDEFQEVFDGFAGHNWSVSWRFLIGVLEIFDGCPGDI